MSVERKQHIDLNRYVRAVAEMTLAEMASTVEAQAVTDAPVATGNLKGSIYKKEVSPTEYEVGADVGYAVYVEFGTGRFAESGGTSGKWTYWSDELQRFVNTEGHSPQPFLRPALDRIRKQAARIWKVESGRYAKR